MTSACCGGTLQAVILVFSHDEMGSAGLILNRPTEHRIGNIPGAGGPPDPRLRHRMHAPMLLACTRLCWVQRCLDAGAEALCPGFADMMLYLGGDVGESTFHILHSYHDLKNAHEVCPAIRNQLLTR